MYVDVEAKAVYHLDISPLEAFRILCETLNMDAVLDEDIQFFAMENPYGDVEIHYIKDGDDMKYDYRGELFIALRETAIALYPNSSLRKIQIND